MGAVLQMTGSVRFIFASFALLLAACTAEPVRNSAGIAGTIRSFQAPDFVPRFAALLEAEAGALQVSFIDKDIQSTLLQEQRRGNFRYWLGADGSLIITENGMLFGTRGLGAGLLTSDLSEPRALVLNGRAGVSDRFHTFLNGDDNAVTRTYRCTITPRGAREVNLGGQIAATSLMREECKSLDQSFVNLYWVDISRKEVVQSRQWTGDFLGNLSTRMVVR